MKKLYDVFRAVEKWAAVASLLFVILLVSWATVTRVFGVPNVWVLEVTQMFFAWTCLLAASIAFRQSSHFSVEFLSQFLPGPLRKWNQVLQNLLILVLVLGVAWVSLDFVDLASRRPMPLSGIRFSWVVASIPVAFVLIALTCVENIIRLIQVGPAQSDSDNLERH